MHKRIFTTAILAILLICQLALAQDSKPIFIGYGGDAKWSPGETSIALLRNDSLSVTTLDAKSAPLAVHSGPILHYAWLDDSTLVTEERTYCEIKRGRAQIVRILKVPLYGEPIELAKDSIKLGTENDRGLKLTKFADGSVGYSDEAVADKSFVMLSSSQTVRTKNAATFHTLFVGTVPDSWGKVWLYYGTTTNGRQVTQSENYYSLPRLAPSGDKLFCWAQRGDLVVFDTSGNELANLGRADMASWDQTGEYIVFCETVYSEFDIEKADVFVANYDGSMRRQVTFTPNIIEFEPTFSPSSHYIIYREYSSGATNAIRFR